MDAFAQVAGTPLGGSTGPIDMSVYGLFMQADWVVKAVMIALLLASFWSWAIIFEKMLRLRSLKRSAQAFEDTFWSGVSLEDLYDRLGAKPAITAVVDSFVAARRRRQAHQQVLRRHRGRPGAPREVQGKSRRPDLSGVRRTVHVQGQGHEDGARRDGRGEQGLQRARR